MDMSRKTEKMMQASCLCLGFVWGGNGGYEVRHRLPTDAKDDAAASGSRAQRDLDACPSVLRPRLYISARFTPC